MVKYKLDSFQEEAIKAARANNSVIVSAPTGAGKTLIAEYIIEDSIKKNEGVIYTAPIKALSNQKFRDFSKKYPQKTGILTGDVNINHHAPILIMTTEIFRNAILVDPKSFSSRSWIIFDEIHYLDDPERGTVWEEAIILLPPQIKMLALSATLPNMNQFLGWLKKIHKFPIKKITETERPVPLHFLFQCDDRIFSSFSDLKKSELLDKKLLKTYHQEKYLFSKPNRLKTLLKNIEGIKAFPCIYFSFSRRKCEELASEVGHLNFLNIEECSKITELFKNLTGKFDVSSSPHAIFLHPLIKKGIAYHHAGLLPALKEIIEVLFSTGLIKLIFTTETFALGINMPAKTIIFDGLSKFYSRHYRHLKTRDFYQMAGRAGRRSIDKEGFVFSRINPSHIDIKSLEKTLYGEYEPIKSQLNSCYATILNLYKTMGDKIYDIYPYSFHFYQSKSWEKKDALSLLKRKISLLKNFDYIHNSTLTPKAKLASKIYGFELIIGEIFECNYFSRLNEGELFILTTALVYEPRKGVKCPKLEKKIKKLKYNVDRIIKNIYQKEHNSRIYPLSKKPFFYLSNISKMWLEGENFSKLNRFSCVDEGEIVRCFRMSIQILREMRSSSILDDSLRNKISNCLKNVNRDVVDAQKQLSQKI